MLTSEKQNGGSTGASGVSGTRTLVEGMFREMMKQMISSHKTVKDVSSEVKRVDGKVDSRFVELKE